MAGSLSKSKTSYEKTLFDRKKQCMGLYNDMTGDADATERWLSEIANGGDYDQTNEEGNFSQCRISGIMHHPVVNSQAQFNEESIGNGTFTDDKSYSKGTFYISWSDDS